MHRNIFASFNYSLLTNFKGNIIDDIVCAILENTREFDLSPQEIMGLLVVTESDIDKPEMSADELSLFENIAFSLSNDDINETGNTISYDYICGLLNVLAQKRVSDNIANCLNLAYMFTKVKGFDIEVLKELFAADENEIDEELYIRDGGLLNLYYTQMADRYFALNPSIDLFEQYMAERDAYNASKGEKMADDNHSHKDYRHVMKNS